MQTMELILFATVGLDRIKTGTNQMDPVKRETPTQILSIFILKFRDIKYHKSNTKMYVHYLMCGRNIEIENKRKTTEILEKSRFNYGKCFMCIFRTATWIRNSGCAIWVDIFLSGLFYRKKPERERDREIIVIIITPFFVYLRLLNSIPYCNK